MLMEEHNEDVCEEGAWKNICIEERLSDRRHVARMLEMRNVYNIFVGNPGVKRSL